MSTELNRAPANGVASFLAKLWQITVLAACCFTFMGLPQQVNGSSYTIYKDEPFWYMPTQHSFNGTKIQIEMTHTPASGDSVRTMEQYIDMFDTVLIDRSQCIFATMFQWDVSQTFNKADATCINPNRQNWRHKDGGTAGRAPQFLQTVDSGDSKFLEGVQFFRSEDSQTILGQYVDSNCYSSSHVQNHHYVPFEPPMSIAFEFKFRQVSGEWIPNLKHVLVDGSQVDSIQDEKGTDDGSVMIKIENTSLIHLLGMEGNFYDGTSKSNGVTIYYAVSDQDCIELVETQQNVCEAAEIMALFSLGNYEFIGPSDTKFEQILSLALGGHPQCSYFDPAISPSAVYPNGYQGAQIDTIEVRLLDTGFQVLAEFATMLPTGTLVQLRGQVSSEQIMEEDIIEDTWFNLVFGCDTPNTLQLNTFNCPVLVFGETRLRDYLLERPTLSVNSGSLSSSCVSTKAAIVETTQNQATFQSQTGTLPIIESSTQIKIPASELSIGTYTFNLNESDLYTGLSTSQAFTIEVASSPPLNPCMEELVQSSCGTDQHSYRFTNGADLKIEPFSSGDGGDGGLIKNIINNLNGRRRVLQGQTAFTCTQVNTSGVTDLCSKAYSTMSSDSDQTAYFDDSTGALYIAQNPNPALASGQYEIIFTDVANSLDCPVLITIDNPCDQATLSFPQTFGFSDSKYLLGEADQDLSFGSWSSIVTTTASSFECGEYQLSLQVSKDSGSFVSFWDNFKDTHFVNNAGNAQKLTKVQTTDTSQLGIYTFEYQVKYKDYPQGPETGWSTETFDWYVNDPCPSATLSFVSPPTATQNHDYVLGDSTTDLLTWANWSELVTLGNVPSGMSCGDYEIEWQQCFASGCSYEALNTAIFTSDSSSKKLTAYTETFADRGDYFLIYKVSLKDYSGIETSGFSSTNDPFYWRFEDCPQQKIDCSSTYNYDFTTNGIDIQPTFEPADSKCSFTEYRCHQDATTASGNYNLCTTSDTNLATFDANSGKLTFVPQQAQAAYIGDYTIRIQYWLANGSYTHRLECRLVFTVSDTNDCASATLSLPSSPYFQNRVYVLGESEDQYDWSNWSNIVSTDATSDCGLYKIEWEQSSGNGSSYQSLDTNIFSSNESGLYLSKIETTDTSEVASYQLRYKVSYKDYSSVETAFSPFFTWQVTDCNAIADTSTCGTSYTYDFSGQNGKRFLPLWSTVPSECGTPAYRCTQTTPDPAGGNPDLCNLSSSVVEFSTSTGQLEVKVTDPGNWSQSFTSYEIVVEKSWSNSSTTSQCTYTLQVENPCLAGKGLTISRISPTNYSDMEYYLGDQEQVLPHIQSNLITVSGSPSHYTCTGEFRVGFQIKKDGDDTSGHNGDGWQWFSDSGFGWQNQNSANSNVYEMKRPLTTDTSLVGTYKLAYSMILNDVDGNEIDRVAISYLDADTFSWTVKSPCTRDRITIQRNTPTTFQNLTYTLGDAEDSQPYTKDGLVTIQSGEPSGMSCGEIHINLYIMKDGVDDSFMAFGTSSYQGAPFIKDDTNNEVKILQTSDQAHVGTYIFYYQVGLLFDEGPSTNFITSQDPADIFTWTVVDSCSSGSISLNRISPTHFQDVTYYLGDSTQYQTYTQSDLVTLSGEPSGVTCSGDLKIDFYVKKDGVDNNYAKLFDSDYGANSQNIFYNSRTGEIGKGKSTELNEIGVYYFSYEGSIEYSDGESYVSRSVHQDDIFTWTILSPCTKDKITVDRASSLGFVNKDYTLGDPSDSQSYSISSLFAISGEPSGITCSTTLDYVNFYIKKEGIDTDYVQISLTSYQGNVFQNDPNNQAFNIMQITDPQWAGTYSISHSAALSFDNDNSQAVFSESQNPADVFTWTVIDPCTKDNISITRLPVAQTSFQDLEYILGEQRQVQPYSRSDIMTVTGEPHGITCGTLALTVFVKKDGDQSWTQLSNYNGGDHLWGNNLQDQELAIESLAQHYDQDFTFSGTYYFSYEATLTFTDNTKKVMTVSDLPEHTFEWIVRDPCTADRIAIERISGTNFINETYYIGDHADQVQAIIRDQVMIVHGEPQTGITCGTVKLGSKIKKEGTGIDYIPFDDSEYVGSDSAFAFSSDKSTEYRKYSTHDTSQAGTYYIAYNAKLEFLDGTLSTTGFSFNEEDIFSWTVVDPCLSPYRSSVQGPSYFNGEVVNYQLGSGVSTVWYHNSANFTAFPYFCGDVTVTLDLDTDQQAWVSQSSRTPSTIEIETNDGSLAATNQTVHFNLTFTDYNDTAADMCILLDRDQSDPNYDNTCNGVVSDSYEIIVHFLPCVVDESDFVLPSFADGGYSFEVGGSPITVPEFAPFSSSSVTACGFEWAYTLTLDSQADLGGQDSTVADYVSLVVDDSNVTQLQISAPAFAKAQSVTVTLTGELAMNLGETLSTSVTFDISYTLPEIDVLESVINGNPRWDSTEVASRYVFDIGNPSAKMSVDLGTISDPEEDPIKAETDSGAKYIQLTESDGEYTLTVDREKAVTGNFFVQVIVSEQLTGQVRQTFLKIDVEITDSTQLPPEETKKSEIEEKEEEKEAATAEITATSKTATLVPVETVKVDLSEFVFKPNFKPVYERVESTQDNEAYNAQIKKPFISQVDTKGSFALNMDSKRFKEAPADSLFRRMLQNESDLLKEEDGQVTVPADKAYLIPVPGFATEDSIKADGISMYLEASEMSNIEALEFSYTVQRFDTEALDIQLNFNSPGSVSATSEKEWLVIQLRDFRDQDGNLIAEDQDIRKSVPNQMDLSTAITAAAAGGAAASAVGGATTINAILSIVMSASMNQMLGSIKNLQVIVHLCLFTLIIPANADMFFAALFDMIAFDPIDVEDQMKLIFTINEETQEIQDTLSTINDKFQDLGYESAFFIKNVGSLILVVMFQMVMIPLSVIVWRCKPCSNKIRKKAGKRLKGCFFNGILTFIDGTIVVLLIMGMINFKMYDLGAVERDDSYYLASVALLVCGLELVFVPLFLLVRWRQGTLGDKKNKKRCGYIYEDLNYKIRGGWTLLYPILYQIRFIALISLILYMNEYLVVQIMIITLCTIAVMTLLGYVHPFEVVRRNYTEIASESVILIVVDLLMCSSDPAVDLDSRMLIGWAIIGILGLSIAFSQGSLIISSIKKLYTKIKLRCIKRKNLKQMALNKEKKALNESRDVTIGSESKSLQARYNRNRENQIDEVAEELEDKQDSEQTYRVLKKSQRNRRTKFQPVNQRSTAHIDIYHQASRSNDKLNAYLDQTVVPMEVEANFMNASSPAEMRLTASPSVMRQTGSVNDNSQLEIRPVHIKAASDEVVDMMMQDPPSLGQEQADELVISDEELDDFFNELKEEREQDKVQVIDNAMEELFKATLQKDLPKLDIFGDDQGANFAIPSMRSHDPEPKNLADGKTQLLDLEVQHEEQFDCVGCRQINEKCFLCKLKDIDGE